MRSSVWQKVFRPFRRSRRSLPCSAASSYRPSFDHLEDRCLLTTLTVTSNADSGANTLRALLGVAVNGDIINFNVTSPIMITSQLNVTTNVTIQGPGASQLTIMDNNSSRIFNFNAGVTASISGLTISGGNAVGGSGAAINNNGGSLTVQDCVLSGNVSTFDGAAIANAGTIMVVNTSMTGNMVGRDGGAIYNGVAGTMTLQNCTISTNTATTDGGGIFNKNMLTVQGSTITGNSAVRGGGIYSNTAGTLMVQSSAITNNTSTGGVFARLGGGGIFCYQNLTIQNSTITGNKSTGVQGQGYSTSKVM